MCLDHLSRINFTWYISRKVSLWNALFEFSKLWGLSIRPDVFVWSWTHGLVHDILLVTRLITKSCGLFLELYLSVKAKEIWSTWLSSIVAVFHCQSPSFLVLSIFFMFKHLNNISSQILLRACVCFTWWLPRGDEACSNGTAQHVA